MICEICGKVHPPMWSEDVEKIKGRIIEADASGDGFDSDPDLAHDAVMALNQLIKKENSR